MDDFRRSFREHVTTVLDEERGRDEVLQQCGGAALAILRTRPADVLAIAHEKLHSFPYKDVPECWRRLYTEAALWNICMIDRNDEWLSQTVRTLDMAVILTGAPGRYDFVQGLLRLLAQYVAETDGLMGSSIGLQSSSSRDHHVETNGSSKRRKVELSIPETFDARSVPKISLHYPLHRLGCLTLDLFETQLKEGLLPFIIQDTIEHWPAFSDSSRTWSNPQIGRAHV